MPKPAPYTATDGTTTWRVRFRHRGRQTSETFATKAEAERFCRTLDDHGADAAVRLREGEQPSDEPHLRELADLWLDAKARDVRSDRTVADYRAAIERHLTPAFGDTPADLVASHDVQRWIDRMHAAGASPKSLRDRHAILHAIYRWARQRGYTQADPCETTRLPKRRPQPPKALTRNEWVRLLPAIRERSDDAADLAHFLVATGTRWSEATALTGSDVEDGATMHVVILHVQRRGADGKITRTADTKSAAGARRIAVDPATAELVRARLPRDPSALVFTTSRGNMWRYSNFRERFWRPAVDAVGLASRAPTVHWLRHTHATWLLQAGVATLQDIQRRLGHASITTTVDTYGRLLSDVRPEALDAFSQMLTAPESSALEG